MIMKNRRPIEPLLWLLFSAGGVMSALFAPVLLFLFGIAFPLGWLAPPDYDRLVLVFGHPLARLASRFTHPARRLRRPRACTRARCRAPRGARCR